MEYWHPLELETAGSRAFPGPEDDEEKSIFFMSGIALISIKRAASYGLIPGFLLRIKVKAPATAGVEADVP